MRFRYALGWLRTTSLAPEERVLWPQGFDRQLSVRQKWPPGAVLRGERRCAAGWSGAHGQAGTA